MMQHFGTPTRLIDVSFNPLIATWFAVQEDPKNAQRDGRLFAVDVTSRFISEDPELRPWADRMDRPWKFAGDQDHPTMTKQRWTTGVYAWRPPGFFGRISKQNGGFLLGGVPTSARGNGRTWQVPKRPEAGSPSWRIAEVRTNTSVALRFHRADRPRTGKDVQPSYTVRILANAKAEIRQQLENQYGYTPSTLYGDYPGSSRFLPA